MWRHLPLVMYFLHHDNEFKFTFRIITNIIVVPNWHKFTYTHTVTAKRSIFHFLYINSIFYEAASIDLHLFLNWNWSMVSRVCVLVFFPVMIFHVCVSNV